MNKKGILIICLIVCLIFAFQSVGAVDVNADSTNGSILKTTENDVVNQSNDFSSVSLPENDESLSAGGGSFLQLQSDITGQTVHLTSNYTYDDSTDSGLTNGIPISGPITIIGDGNIVIDARNHARVFTISGDSKVTIVGITFVNCNVNGDGGSILSNSPLNITNCNFINSTATGSDGNGGAIAIASSGSTITNCQFSNCYSTKDGAALNIMSSNCQVYNSTFTDNTAGDDGGAINWMGDEGIIYNITCINNKGISLDTSTSNGGTICLTGSNVVIRKSSFTQSSATIAGGAILITGNNVNITESTFSTCNVSQNKAPSGTKTYVTGGGSIYILGNYTNVKNCTFDNSNGREGGVIYIQGHDVTLKGIVTTNSYAVNGGAFYLKGDNITLSTNTSLSNVTTSGGAIYIQGNNAIVNNSIFKTSKSLGTTNNPYGGTIYVKGNYAVINNSKFIDSYAKFYGGSIYIIGNHAWINNGTFSNSVSDANGGSIYIDGSFTNVSKSVFDGGKASNGAGIYIHGNNATVRSSNFTNLKIGSNGAGIYSDGLGSKVYDSNFINNGPSKSGTTNRGGAIYWKGGSMEDLIEGCNFDQNKASHGPAVYMDKSDVETAGVIRYCNFTHNVGGRAGTVAWSSSNNAVIEYCYFAYNSVEKHGAAIYAGADDSLNSTHFKIYKCVFEHNWATKGVGGALSIRISGTEVISCNFTGNSASSGGSIMLKEHGVSNVTIDKCNFYDSRALDNGASEYGSGGGAIAVWGVDAYDPQFKTNNMTVTNCLFVNCSSPTYGGGAIDWSSSNGKLENCTFIKCSAPYGGSLGIESINTTFKNITIINSTATSYGAGIYIGDVNLKSGNKNTHLSANKCTLNDIKIINANTQGNGAAIYINSKAEDITLINLTISNSQANNGGGMYIEGNKIKVYDSKFNDNSAVNGGAIYSQGNTMSNAVIINNTEFTLNHADFDGGAIYSSFKGSNIAYCTFNDNTAGGNGAAIAIMNSDNNVNYCIFNENNAEGNGGGIYIASVNQIYIRNSTFTKNHAFDGAGVYNTGTSGATAYIINNTFRKNNATHNGGAILYIVDATVAHPAVYRDYNNFDGKGNYSQTTQRTSLTMESSGTPYSGRISVCLFDNNVDYEFIIDAHSDLNTTTGIIYITKPNDPDKPSLNLTVIIFNSTSGDVVKSLVINKTNFEDYFNQHEQKFAISFDDLTPNSQYNVTITYEDDYYMNKVQNTTLFIYNVTRLGQFQLLQVLIDNAFRSAVGDEAVLVLDRPYTFTRGLDTSCIKITEHAGKTLKIIGNGWTVDADGQCRIFNITANNVVLINLVLNDGNSKGNASVIDNIDKGGAIYWYGSNGQIINSTIKNSKSEYGGGIYFNPHASDAKVTNCIFNSSYAIEHGGAIDCNASRMNLTNTKFNNNYADYGAALCRESISNGGFGYNNSFINNNAKTAGAALAWMNSSSIKIDKYYFKDNTAGYSGGAIYVGNGSGNCKVLNSIFINNYVTSNSDGHGGAIEWYAKEGLVSNSNFSDNHAYNGGAIYVGSASGKINITGSNFHDNYAITNGGAISLDASSVTINTSNFWNNSAINGAAMYVGGEGFTNYVQSSIFDNNIAYGNGGAIDWVASSGHLINTNFTNNYAYYGAGVYMGGNSEGSIITGCLFDNNTARYNGGGIDWNSTGGQLILNVFKSNTAQFGAALCREAGATSGFGYNNTFISNHAYLCGAALGWMGSVGISITNYTFINNTADIGGGAIFVGPDSHNCSIFNCYFENNYVINETTTSSLEWESWDGNTMSYEAITTDDPSKINKIFIEEYKTTFYYPVNGLYEYNAGGAVFIIAANASVVDSEFKSNFARLGGALYVATDYGTTFIQNSTFTSNLAYERGGAMNIRASGVSVNASEFKDNVAINGGALYVSGQGITNYVLNSRFIGNNATNGHGGAIDWVAAQGDIHFSNFTGNSAKYGGAVYFNGESHNSSVINVIFKENRATKNGGAIDWDARQGKLYNTTFISNYAGEYGAALCRESGATGGSGKNNTFIGNHAEIAGAALAWLEVEGININDYHFINNTAVQYGGAIYVSKGSDNCVVNMSSFKGNYIKNATGGYGGAIGILANNATIINSNFTDNSAGNGGALWVGSDSGNTNITNVTFDRNSARINGGAINL
ncbi:MAG: hypothetical protein E7Z80_05645, partial [Methanobrevibacter thaueri]|nr:hypothetical protein [Methanobrevibacter thaueri]